MTRVLIVEDDATINSLIYEYLTEKENILPKKTSTAARPFPEQKEGCFSTWKNLT